MANKNIDNDENKTLNKFNIGDFIKNKLLNIKIFKIKNFKIIGLVVLLIIIVIAYLFFIPNNKVNKGSNKLKVNYTNSIEYANKLEEKLTNLLSNISNIGKTSVMVTLSSSLEVVYAESVDEKNNTTVSQNNSTTNNTSSSNTIIVKNNGEYSPIVLKEILPTIKGVVVVCEGAKDINIKLKIIQAIKALLDIPANNIQVFN